VVLKLAREEAGRDPVDVPRLLVRHASRLRRRPGSAGRGAGGGAALGGWGRGGREAGGGRVSVLDALSRGEGGRRSMRKASAGQRLGGTRRFWE
jgi:hypothetical protein